MEHTTEILKPLLPYIDGAKAWAEVNGLLGPFIITAYPAVSTTFNLSPTRPAYINIHISSLDMYKNICLACDNVEDPGSLVFKTYFKTNTGIHIVDEAKAIQTWNEDGIIFEKTTVIPPLTSKLNPSITLEASL